MSGSRAVDAQCVEEPVILAPNTGRRSMPTSVSPAKSPVTLPMNVMLPGVALSKATKVF